MVTLSLKITYQIVIFVLSVVNILYKNKVKLIFGLFIFKVLTWALLKNYYFKVFFVTIIPSTISLSYSNATIHFSWLNFTIAKNIKYNYITTFVILVITDDNASYNGNWSNRKCDNYGTKIIFCKYIFSIYSAHYLLMYLSR